MSSGIINRAFTLILNFPLYELYLSQLDIALHYFSQNLFLSDVQVIYLQTTINRIDCNNLTLMCDFFMYNFLFPSYICMSLLSAFILPSL